MTTINTLQELKKALHGESQNDNTRCGWVMFNGQKLYVRKHWSYDGGYPVYTDETCTTSIGELFCITETAQPAIDENGKPILRHGYQTVYDFELKLVLDEKN